MTQDERWLVKYNEIMAFMADNHRRPSKYNMEERNNWNWIRHTQKQYGAGELKAERVEELRSHGVTDLGSVAALQRKHGITNLRN